MKIVIIRHAEPDYENNTLTEKGFIEAAALGKYYNADMFKSIYSSTLNRAKYTAEAIVKGKKEINMCDWLVEFGPPIKYEGRVQCPWDFMPEYFDNNEFLTNKNWYENPLLMEAGIKKSYDNVIQNFDSVLAKYGYVRDGNIYRVEKENTDTLLFVCHFGMMSVLLSRLLNIPFPLLSQHFSCYPSGVTTVVSEERKQGICQFRLLEYSNVEHLKKENLEPSFMGRFTEIFSGKERH